MKLINGPVLMQNTDPSDDQLAALMREVRDLALERKQAAAQRLAKEMANEMLVARKRWNLAS
ncbi:MAG: hypothetical protein ACRCV9_01780 [Burkholderiaceae bacterium]